MTCGIVTHVKPMDGSPFLEYALDLALTTFALGSQQVGCTPFNEFGLNSQHKASVTIVSVKAI